MAIFTLLVGLAMAVGGVISACPVGFVAPCDCVIPQQNVTSEQISGLWYLVESSTSSAAIAENRCYGIILSPNLKAGFDKSKGEDPSFVNTTLETNSSSSWYERDAGYYTNVVFYSENLSSLALVSCVPIMDQYFQWVGIFNRQAVPNPLPNLNEYLGRANVNGIQNLTHYDNQGC